ncbi:hypothetical protein SK128_021284, partial [Halocaridina rubra]
SRADLMECRVVADVSTLYGEMVSNNNNPNDIHAAHTSAAETLPPPPIPPHTHNNVYADASQIAHGRMKPDDAYIESQSHVHHAQYTQQKPPCQDYQPPTRQPPTSPPPVDMMLHEGVSFHQSMAQAPPHLLGNTQEGPALSKNLAYASTPVSYTQTLPHPRSSHSRSGHNAHPATLQRRSSLYIDPVAVPMGPPIAPPPAYGSPTSPLVSDMVAVVPMVAETVCITPNNPLHAYINPPEQYPPKPFPSSFSSDRMESAV